MPVKTVQDLVALAKSKPGLLNFAVSGIGGAPHLAGVAFEAQTGVKWTYIPYKGGSDAIIGLASGQADAIFNGMLAPAATPPEILTRIHAEIVKFVQAPEIRKRFASQGVELQASTTPGQFTAYIKIEYARWAQVLDDAGIKAE